MLVDPILFRGENAASRPRVASGEHPQPLVRRRSVAMFSGYDGLEPPVADREAVAALADACGIDIDGEYVDVRRLDGTVAHSALDVLLGEAARGEVHRGLVPRRSSLGGDAVDALWSFARLAESGIEVHVGGYGKISPRDLALPGPR